MNIAAKVFALGLGLTMGLSSLAPAQAATFKVSPTVTGESDVVQVHRRGRYHRHYRRYNNGAAIVGAIIGGALIGGAIIAHERRYRRRSRRSYRSRDAHVGWCYRRYRSYRAYDNTFQPYRGGRRYCRSPYR